MKKIFINNLYFPYARGGAETVVRERARQALEQGDEVIVITLAKYKTEHNQVFWDGKIKVIRIWPRNIFSYFDLNKHNFVLKLVWHFIDILGCVPELKQILLSEKPDVVETHNLIGTQCRNFKFQISNFKFRWVHYLHDIQLVEPSGVLTWNHNKDNFAQKIYSAIIKRRMGNPDEVISPSEFLKEFYQERGFFQSSKWTIDYRLLTTENELRETIVHRPLSIVQFLFVGSLVEHKGIRILMKAWDSLCSNYSRHSRVGGNPTSLQDPRLRGDDVGEDNHFFLNIIGDGDLRTEVEEWAKNKKSVQVLGRLEGEQLENVYKQSDVLIMPSICLENRPTVILEAQKYGLQVIASDTGGVRELVDRESLVEPGNVEELVNKIKQKSR